MPEDLASVPSTNELLILGAPIVLRDGSRIRIRQPVAEVAVTVIDDWQRLGVGGLLLEVLSARARE